MTAGDGSTQFVSVMGSDIAYRVAGAGPPLVTLGNWCTNIDAVDSIPVLDRYMRSVARFSTSVHIDMPGSGMSDSLPDDPFGTPDTWPAVVEAVMAAVGIDRAHLLAVDYSTHPALSFASKHPERVAGIILFHPALSPGLPTDLQPPDIGRLASAAVAGIRSLEGVLRLNPSLSEDPTLADQWLRWLRNCMAPSVAERMYRAILPVDSRILVESISAPMLALTTGFGNRLFSAHARYLVEKATDCVHRCLDFPDAFPISIQATSEFAGAIEEFMTGRRTPPAETRSLLAILFTDLVDSTGTASRLGDARWREVLIAHEELTRDRVTRLNGRVANTTGDGTLAVFPTATAALDCVRELRMILGGQGLVLRAGIHVAEVETIADNVGGIGVHVAARVQSLAPADEVYVTAVVPTLVLGGYSSFESVGSRTLRGVPGKWDLFRLV